MATVLLDCAYRKQNNKKILIFNYFTLENKQFIKYSTIILSIIKIISKLHIHIFQF